jgi:hypothetical protein
MLAGRSPTAASVVLNYCSSGKVFRALRNRMRTSQPKAVQDVPHRPTACHHIQNKPQRSPTTTANAVSLQKSFMGEDLGLIAELRLAIQPVLLDGKGAPSSFHALVPLVVGFIGTALGELRAILGVF